MSAPLPPPGSGSGSSTQEIPVVPAAVANTQHLPPPPSAPTEAIPDAMRTTGPVEFVPEPPPAAKTTRISAAGRRGPAAVVPAALGVVVLELGLAFSFGSRSFWSAIPLWSAFATAVCVIGLVAVVGQARGIRGGAWRVAAGALTGLAVFWLLVVLPVADTDRGFLLTAALGLLGAAVWLCPRSGR